MERSRAACSTPKSANRSPSPLANKMPASIASPLTPLLAKWPAFLTSRPTLPAAAIPLHRKSKRLFISPTDSLQRRVVWPNRTLPLFAPPVGTTPKSPKLSPTSRSTSSPTISTTPPTLKSTSPKLRSAPPPKIGILSGVGACPFHAGFSPSHRLQPRGSPWPQSSCPLRKNRVSAGLKHRKPLQPARSRQNRSHLRRRLCLPQSRRTS